MTLCAPGARPIAPSYASASLLTTFLACPLRAAFALDPRWRHLRRSGLRAALGTAAHAVAARIGTGVTFDEAWDQETKRARDRLEKEWAPATPPSVLNWPGAALTRARLAKWWSSGSNPLASTALFTRDKPGGNAFEDGPPAPGQPPLPWRERWLQPDGLGIAGRPDLVERTDHLRVVDLKTGLRHPASTVPRDTGVWFWALSSANARWRWWGRVTRRCGAGL